MFLLSLFGLLSGYVLFYLTAMNLAEGTKRDSGVIFHKIGIAAKDTDSGFKGWKLRTLSELKNLLFNTTTT